MTLGNVIPLQQSPHGCDNVHFCESVRIQREEWALLESVKARVEIFIFHEIVLGNIRDPIQSTRLWVHFPL